MKLRGFLTKVSYLKPRHILVTGGTRSGKSEFAESLAGSLVGNVVYLATAAAYTAINDEEMNLRIAKHQQRRPLQWLTVEEPINLHEILLKYQTGYTIILDCLTIYISNLLFTTEVPVAEADREIFIKNRLADLAEIINSSDANIIIVSNEVGWGIVPENKLARVFRDLAGIANQIIAGACSEVYLVVSGIPVKIKGEPDVAKI